MRALSHLKRVWSGPRSRVGIFAFFAVGILLLSAILGYLAFRSFQYERVLLRQETEGRNRAAAEILVRRMTEQINQPLEALRQAFAGSGAHAGRHARIKTLLAVGTLAGYPVEAQVLLDVDGRLVFPAPLASAAGFTERDVEWGLLTDEIERLERLEFADKQYAVALAG